MKKNSLGGIAFLLLAVAVAVWLNRPENTGPHPAAKGGAQTYILALSWQPAFCERRPNRPECRSQRETRFDAANFSLHGLWPQPENNLYCGVSTGLVSLDKSGRWMQLPKLELSDGLRKELSLKMPGYRSGLHRHEWIKHGTCMQGSEPEAYFRISLDLLDQLNGTDLASLMRENINRRLDYRALETAFERSLGSGSGGRLVVDCYRDDGRRIISEIKLSLTGKNLETLDLKQMVSAAPRLGGSCPSGIVDRVGQQ